MQYEISILSNLANIVLINFCQLPTIFSHLLTMDEKVCKTFDKVWCKGATFKSKPNEISNELIKVLFICPSREKRAIINGQTFN